jgi:hypothetical protein
MAKLNKNNMNKKLKKSLIEFKKAFLEYIKSKYFTPATGICVVSLFFLILISPVFSILWLCIPTLYFLYMHSYKSILNIWGFTIGVWYLIFTTTLAEIPILIGFDHTKLVLIYLIQNDVLFANLCFQTVVILDLSSSKLGFPIYIPAVINIFSLKKLF